MMSTIASLIRENGNAIRALATSMSQDGKKYLYKDILVTLGLPTSPSHIRALSKFLNKDGIRRREPFTRKRSDHPEIPALIQDEHASIQNEKLTELAEIASRKIPMTVPDVDEAIIALNVMANALNQAQRAIRNFAESLGFVPVEGETDVYRYD